MGGGGEGKGREARCCHLIYIHLFIRVTHMNPHFCKCASVGQLAVYTIQYRVQAEQTCCCCCYVVISVYCHHYLIF